MSDSSQEKTEQPTHKKLKKAREKGQVAQSKEVISTFTIIGMSSLLLTMGSSIFEDMKVVFSIPRDYLNVDFEKSLSVVLELSFDILLGVLAPFMAAVIILVVTACMIQFGLILQVETLKPKLEKLDPVKNFKNLFKLKQLVELLKSIIKIILLSVFIYYVISRNFQDVMEMIYCGVGCIPLMLYHVLFWLIFVTCIAFVIISVIDYLYQKHEFIKGQKMTKDEIKREYKDSEGTPEIKGRRKQIHKELATQDVQSTVKKSTMVVANPTHVAIALVCYSEGDKLPIIGAKGKDSMAKLIKSIAKENNIPIVEYVPLARALFEDGLIDKYVPQHLLGPVGDTLSWVQKNFKSDDK